MIKKNAFVFSAFELTISWERRKLLTKITKIDRERAIFCREGWGENVGKMIFQVYYFQL